MSRMLVDLSPDALVRVFAAEPALPSSLASEAAIALGKLLQQFIREGRCSAGAAEPEEDGRFLVVAWEGPPLSGCSHDKIAQVIAAYETRSGCAILAAPPIAIGQRGAVRLTDRTGLRNLLASGAGDAHTPVWNLRVATVGEWRNGPVALASSTFARLLAPIITSREIVA